MTWYRSLYWRVAIGFVLFLATMLVVQSMLFTWVVARSGQTLPEAPAAFAQTIAQDVGSALEDDPSLNVGRYVHDQYSKTTHPFLVLLSGGQVVDDGIDPAPEELIQRARLTLRRMQRFERGDLGRRPDWSGRLDKPDGPARFPLSDRLEGQRRDQDPAPPRFIRPVPILVHGQTAGVVVVPPRASFRFLLRRFAPTLALVATSVLVVGTVMASVLIFGPPRRRLRSVEAAARRLGAGDLSARVPERGGDEIAAVAGAFNTMASDLAARADALASSDRARRQLLADVSHELTTPVTAMRGYLETLTMPELSLDETTRTRYLTIISDETARLERIIGDLLDLARLESGGGSFNVEEVPVQHLFDRVSARHERRCQQAQITVDCSIEAGAEHVMGDADRLEQALQNLAANAIRYTPAGSTVRLTAQPVTDGVRLTVEDGGPGIPPEHLPHIFDRFYKAEAARTGNSGGSGLGLSIVKAIVKRHEGRVSVTSEPGHTVFEIVLPPGVESVKESSVEESRV